MRIETPLEPSTSCTGIRMVYYYYGTVLHLSGYSVNSHFSIRVRVWYYFIFRDRYMK